MIKSLLFVPMVLATLTARAQGAFIPKDPFNDQYGHQWNYLHNMGQCFDLGGNFRPDILFQSVGTAPTVSVMTDGRTSLCLPVWHEDDHSLDSTIRLDFTFVGQMVNTTQAELYDSVGAHWNFYEEYTPYGVTNVTGGKRLVQQNICDRIDYHVLSNAYGPKFLIVIRPGGDPDDIILKFEGQDSLQVDIDGMLRMYANEKFYRLEQGFAYQQQGTSVVVVPWQAEYENVHGSSLVTFQLGTYDPTLPLILLIRPWQQAMGGGGGGGGGGWPLPEWCTYLNGSGSDAVTDMTLGANGYVYFTGNSRSNSGFPIFPGFQQFQHGGDYDVIYGRFNSNYELEGPDVWMTYLGGSDVDFGTGIAYDNTQDRVWLCGYLRSTSPANMLLASNPNCYQRTGGTWGFVAFASASNGLIKYLTRYQGAYGATITGIDCDQDGNAYVVGWGDPDGFDLVDAPGTSDHWFGGPFPSVPIWWDDGFIARFNADAEHTWATALRGPDADRIRGVHVDRPHNKIYVYGMTRTPNNTGVPDGSPGAEQYEFPLKNAGGWYQPVLNSLNYLQYYNFDALVMRFDRMTLALEWSTYVGGSGGNECITDAVTDAAGNVYFTGYSDSPGYSATPCGWTALNYGFPACHPGTAYFQSANGGVSDNIMLKFDIATDMQWSTFVGGSKREEEHPSSDFLYPRLAMAGHPANIVTLFASTASGVGSINVDPPIPMVPHAAYYQQLWHGDVGLGAADPVDCYYAVFGMDGTPVMASYFGGIGDDWPGGLVTTGTRLYVGGATHAAVNFPLNCPPGWLPMDPYCDQAPLATPASADAYLAQLRSVFVTAVEEQTALQGAQLDVFPNPTDGTALLIDPDGLAGKKVLVMDAVGRTVFQAQGLTGTSLNLDLGGQADGLYLIAVLGPCPKYIRLVKN